MSPIEKGQVKMKPKWYFLLGSFAMTLGVLGLTIVLVFLTSLMAFALRHHGPRGANRFQELLSSFPWWALIIFIIGTLASVCLFRKYDFSYKKSFIPMIAGFILAVILFGWLINYLGLDNFWMKRGPMKGFYQRYNSERIIPSSGRSNLNTPCLKQ